MSKNNLDVRQELAALYRILDIYGMTDLANQCAAARSSENKNTFLVHQYGMFYDEITASSLIEVDNNGKPLDPKSPYYFSGWEQDAQSKANELNENLFKLDKKQVAEIVLSSMFGRR